MRAAAFATHTLCVLLGSTAWTAATQKPGVRGAAAAFSTSSQRTDTRTSRWWESRSQTALTAAVLAAGAGLLWIKGRDAVPDKASCQDPLAEIHARDPPSDPHTRLTARVAQAFGADPSDPEKDTIFDNKRIAMGPVGDLLPAGRRSAAREVAAASAQGVDTDAVIARTLAGKGAQPALPREALDKPAAAGKRTEEIEASPVKVK